MRTARVASVIVVLFSATGAHAQATSVATARQLALTGIDAVESGHCDKGVPLLERAEQLHHAAVHLQYLARCRVAAGRLVAATEMWRRIVREGIPEGSSPAIATAVAEAQAGLDKTLPRLASTTVHTTEDYPGLTLTIDGTKLPGDLVGTRQILDPGDHELTVTATGYENWSRRWTLAEGGAADIVVDLTPLPETGSPETPPLPSDTGRPRPSTILPVAGWITASVGAASLIAGTVTLLSRNSRRSDLANKCPDQTCLPSKAYPGVSLERAQAMLDDEKNTIRDLTTASNILLWGGGALVAGGVTMIVLGGHKAPKEQGTALVVGAPRAMAGLTVQGRW